MHVIDVVPTILEVAGIPAPETVDGIEQAPIEGTRQMLDLARREGRPVRHPVRLRSPVIQIARFHFGEDFEIVPVYVPGGTDLDLYPRDDPAVLERSIGRGGLTLRLSP